jgi:predicted AlkP superfamily phosphohydrolase/phosphomutase
MWRNVLRGLAVAGLLGIAAGLACDRNADRGGRRVIVLGFDGMDYALTREMLAAGRLPHLQRLAASGTFTALETAIPPQSPVAWSNVITGLDAGGHGIFDFIHRDAATLLPYLSTSRSHPPRTLRVGPWRIALSGGKIELLRRGTPFWEDLTAGGIATTIVRMPANFPPTGTATRELSGMGTPDLLGTYGEFTFFSSDASVTGETAVSGGRIVAARLEAGVMHGRLRGPDNPLRAAPEPLYCDFVLYLDPERPLAKLVVGAEERLIAQGEWSDWVPVEFELAPLRTLRGMCRFYAKQLLPALQLYASPINIDPMQPALPIAAPPGWAAELARQTGRYYTQGIAQETKAYSAGVFDAAEFLAQARLVFEENRAQYRAVLAHFERGVLSFYFGEPDQTSHMMWRPMDPVHPAYDPVVDAPFAGAVREVYERMDAIVGETLAHVDSATTLIVMSDHGFASWRRAFHLNAWLRQQGYLVTRDPERDDATLLDVDWARTRAYGLGLNGLYINVRGRERQGIVEAEDRAALVAEIAAGLQAVRDPVTGSPAVTRVYRPESVFTAPTQLDVGPDLIIGYAKGTRCANASALGGVETLVFSDNTDAWSGDHCMDHTAVPGVLFVNRALSRPVTRLQDLGAAVAAEFGR